MNKRIRQLERQAMISVLNGNDPDGDVDRMYISAEFTKKFAELIVQECIDIIAPYSVRMIKPGEEYLHPIQEIRKHFGVEE